MRLKAYVESKGRGEIARLAKDSGLTYGTIWNLVKKEGELLTKYETAKRLSDATRGEDGKPAVSVAELCEPERAPVPKRKRAANGNGKAH